MSGTRTWSDWSCSVAVRIERGSLDRAEGIVRSTMQEVTRSISRFHPSDLQRINRASGRLVPVSRRTIELLDVALDAARATAGDVTPTLGSQLVDLGYDRDIEALRSGPAVPAAPAPALDPTPGWRDVRIDHDLGLVGIPRGAALDLGAVAKAWTADEAARRVESALGTPTLVEIGGDVAVAGDPTQPWQVDVAESRGAPGDRVGLVAGGLATSSTTARRWTDVDGRIISHVLDPRTGRPTTGPWRTVSVWAPSALAANVASTAALVSGREALRRCSSELAVRAVRSDGVVEYIGSWPGQAEVAA